MEWLKAKLGEELYSQVFEKVGENGLLENNGNYIPKSKFNEINEKNKNYVEQLKTFEENNLKVDELLSTNSKMSEQFKALKEKNALELAEKDKQMNLFLKKSKVMELLQNNKVLYPELIIDKINMDTVALDGESLQGFNIEDWKTKFPNLFIQTDLESNITSKNPTNSILGNQSSKQKLIEQYNDAEKSKNLALMMSLQREIKALQK